MSEHALDIPGAVRDRLEELSRQHADLERRLADPEVLADHHAVRELSIRKAAIAPLVADYTRLAALRAEEAELSEAAAGSDRELAELARDELPRIRDQAARLIESIKSRLVNAEDEQITSVMLELRAGTGGDEAAIWTRDLLEMYQRYASRRGWEFELLDVTEEPGVGGVGGVRNAVVNVRGEGVWTRLRHEAGVHSVKRVPATETQGRIHTSTATVAVLPEPEEVDVEIDWSRDVTEHVTTAQGPGGQNVNKVATAVHLVHNPTGIEVRMQESKSQHQNREKARRLLLARLFDLQQAAQTEERSAQRRAQIGSAQRSEKIRTYRYKESIAVDERLGGNYPLRDLLAGDLDRITDDLVERETARRLESL